MWTFGKETKMRKHIYFFVFLLFCHLSEATSNILETTSNENDHHGANEKMEEELFTSPFPATENYNESGFSGNWTNETGSGNWTIGEGKSGVISLNFLDSFVKALSVMIVSELGDKTFFLAGILAMRYNKLTVFLGAISSLVLMTVVSALLGYGVTSLIPYIYTFYASVVIMFIFGLKMFWDAWKMKPNEAEELQNEAEADINRRERRGSERNPADPEGTPMENLGQAENPENGTGSQPDHEVKVNEGFFSQIISSIQFWKKSDHRFSRAPTDEHPVRQASPSPSIPLPEIEAPNSESGEQKPESSRFGKQCLKIFKVFVNAFGLIFLAEWGDRSQLATIVLASVNDVAGVILGGVLGHTLCTGLAVLAGALIAKKISVRAVTIIGGVVFIGFAIATLVYGPEESESEEITTESL